MEEGKLFDQCFELPDGYEVQMMVLMEVPSKRPRVARYRSRLWIGHADLSDPLLYKSQEYDGPSQAIDACYSLLLKSAPEVIDSPDALAAVREQVHSYFSGAVPGR